MKESLLDKVTQELPKRSKSCVKNILLLVQCILLKETVCLYKLKGAVGGLTGKPHTQADSHYKRLIRIFDAFSGGDLWLELLQFSFRLLRLKSDYLLLDGTSWEKGNRRFHYLTLCVVYQGVAIPIYWQDLAKKGSSSVAEREELLKKAFRYFNLKDKILLADREYIGENWFDFLRENEIDFVIRLRARDYKEAVNAAAGKSYGTMERKVLRSRKVGKTLGKIILLQGRSYCLVVLKNPKAAADEPLIYLLSSLVEEAPARIAARYPIRWQIELCFKHLKSNGFQLEAINLTGAERSRLLVAVVIFAYTISVCEGLKQYRKVPVKNYKDGKQTKTVSVFRKGLDKVVAFCCNMEIFLKYILENLVTKLPAFRSKKSIIV